MTLLNFVNRSKAELKENGLNFIFGPGKAI